MVFNILNETRHLNTWESKSYFCVCPNRAVHLSTVTVLDFPQESRFVEYNYITMETVNPCVTFIFIKKINVIYKRRICGVNSIKSYPSC